MCVFKMAEKCVFNPAEVEFELEMFIKSFGKRSALYNMLSNE